jgi:hypothetical protein
MIIPEMDRIVADACNVITDGKKWHAVGGGGSGAENLT